jgi:hypothetical protein
LKEKIKMFSKNKYTKVKNGEYKSL